MTMVVTQPCIGCKDKACLTVCPTDCFHEDEQMVYINPDDCVDCEACIPECPTEAIFGEDDVPERWKDFIALNAIKADACPPACE
ncbi:4Fe-4S ferredoxin iron-sulfur binding domain-containing protein [Rhodopirellula baltica SH28]|uniref:Ferredoxin n=1 Tax=Rhodopirellula baltica SH28 TaxID=993517 RepID=K5DPJ3_RHOBT|nr:ferredoxin family protein [Rhodopirellula baltica]EKK04403.1 4Fe-4S ferredoxin iron-sulfur binding domain-containing protein [Rhodopirellula baltica SH28]